MSALNLALEVNGMSRAFSDCALAILDPLVISSNRNLYNLPLEYSGVQTVCKVSVIGVWHPDYSSFRSAHDFWEAHEKRQLLQEKYLEEISQSLEQACLWLHQIHSIVNGFEHHLLLFNEKTISFTRRTAGRYIYEAYELQREYLVDSSCLNSLDQFFGGLENMVRKDILDCHISTVDALPGRCINASRSDPMNIFKQWKAQT